MFQRMRIFGLPNASEQSTISEHFEAENLSSAWFDRFFSNSRNETSWRDLQKLQNVFQLCFASASSRNFQAGHKISNEITAFFHEFSHSKSHWQLHFQEISKNWQKRTAVFIADIWRSKTTFLRQMLRWQIIKYQKLGVDIDTYFNLDLFPSL